MTLTELRSQIPQVDIKQNDLMLITNVSEDYTQSKSRAICLSDLNKVVLTSKRLVDYPTITNTGAAYSGFYDVKINSLSYHQLCSGYSSDNGIMKLNFIFDNSLLNNNDNVIYTWEISVPMSERATQYSFMYNKTQIQLINMPLAFDTIQGSTENVVVFTLRYHPANEVRTTSLVYLAYDYTYKGKL